MEELGVEGVRVYRAKEKRRQSGRGKNSEGKGLSMAVVEVDCPFRRSAEIVGERARCLHF